LIVIWAIRVVGAAGRVFGSHEPDEA